MLIPPEPSLPATEEIDKDAAMLTCGKPGDSAITCGRGEVHEMRSRFEHLLHIGPYGSLGERPACGKAVADGVWSPPGGSGHFVSQQADTIAGIDFADALKPGPRNGGNSPITVAQIIAAVTRGLNTTIGEGLQIEAEQFAGWLERMTPARFGCLDRKAVSRLSTLIEIR